MIWPGIVSHSDDVPQMEASNALYYLRARFNLSQGSIVRVFVSSIGSLFSFVLRI